MIKKRVLKNSLPPSIKFYLKVIEIFHYAAIGFIVSFSIFMWSENFLGMGIGAVAGILYALDPLLSEERKLTKTAFDSYTFIVILIAGFSIRFYFENIILTLLVCGVFLCYSEILKEHIFLKENENIVEA